MCLSVVDQKLLTSESSDMMASYNHGTDGGLSIDPSRLRFHNGLSDLRAYACSKLSGR